MRASIRHRSGNEIMISELVSPFTHELDEELFREVSFRAATDGDMEPGSSDGESLAASDGFGGGAGGRSGERDPASGSVDAMTIDGVVLAVPSTSNEFHQQALSSSLRSYERCGLQR